MVIFVLTVSLLVVPKVTTNVVNTMWENRDPSYHSKYEYGLITLIGGIRKKAYLQDISMIINGAISQIANPGTHLKKHDVERDVAELMRAFEIFVKFYLHGDNAAREAIIGLINTRWG